MSIMINDVVVIDAVRTAFGRAGQKGVFWNTRVEDLCVPLVKAMIERNPSVKPEMICHDSAAHSRACRGDGLLERSDGDS